MPILVILSVAAFTSALSMRMLDPVVPQIARDLLVDPQTAALLGTAFALPYAIGQPVMGTLGDAIGKARVIQVCLAALGLALLWACVAPSYQVLVVARVLSGFFGGGVIPLAFAIVGDRFEFAVRQVALSRVVMATLVAQRVGTVGAGIVASLVSWRVVLAAAGLLGIMASVVTYRNLKPRAGAPRVPVTIAGMRRTYAGILASPRARVCYAAVFVEGLLIFGVPPFIAVLLEGRGAGGVREAGFVIAGIGLGGLAYTLSVRKLLAVFRGMLNLMRAGGAVCGAGLALLALELAWPLEMAACVVLGFGFFMLHNSLQTQATEISTTARGAGVALFAFFFFMGSALGPAAYGIGLSRLGPAATFLIAGAVMSALGAATARGFVASGSLPAR